MSGGGADTVVGIWAGRCLGGRGRTTPQTANHLSRFVPTTMAKRPMTKRTCQERTLAWRTRLAPAKLLGIELRTEPHVVDVTGVESVDYVYDHRPKSSLSWIPTLGLKDEIKVPKSSSLRCCCRRLENKPDMLEY
ncbi:hypothetical protein V1478_018358, partial [Vespula squamosa]